MVPTDLPGGIFSFFLDLWTVLRETFFNLIDWITSNSIEIGGEDFTVISVLIGGGLVVYLVTAVAKWIIGIFWG